MSLIEYREQVQRLARKRDGEPIYNGSIEHASVIIENMFAYAKSRVSILSDNLNARAYGRDEIIEQAGLFLAGENHQVQILLEDASQKGLKDHPFFDKFAKNENLTVRSISPEYARNYGFHLLVMDDDSYRFESDKGSHAAIAAFGDTDGASSMRRFFDSVWTLSEPVELPQLAETA